MMNSLTIRGAAGPRAAFKAAARRQHSARRTCMIVQAKDNPYHDRNYQKKGNPGGTKDINQMRKDRQDQYEYQQERLEWRRKNQGEGIEYRDEPPHTNMAKDMSAERRGPDVPDSAPDTASLGKKDNVIGKVIRKVTGMKDEDK